MSQVLDTTKAISQDVLLVEHRTSEPFDHPIDPASLATIVFHPGELAAVNASGYIERATAANAASIKVLGLFCLPSTPSDTRKNNYVQASGHASVFSNGIVRLSTQISNAAVNATDVLYLGTDGKLTTANTSGVRVGIALTSRTEATAFVRVKIEL